MIETLFGLGFLGLLIVAIAWLLPIILILRSGRTSGGEKFVWILLVLFFSWFSWILYALLAPIARKLD